MSVFAKCIRPLLAFFVSTLLVAVPQLHGQTVSPTGGSVPTANLNDVSSIDAIMVALYGSISGSPDQERDWDRFRSLFTSEARLIPTIPIDDGVGFRADPRTVEIYIEGAAPFFAENGFFEVESNRVTEVFENIAHVFSTYESRRTPDGPVFQRGINSIQLMFDGRRWWVMNIFWRGVGADFEFSDKYLPER